MSNSTTWVIRSSRSNGARNTYGRKGHCVESQVNLSIGDTVKNPRVLEQGNAIHIRELFTIQKAAPGLLLGHHGDGVSDCGTSRGYVTRAAHQE